MGTWELLPDEERRLLRGYLINRFRGDVRLFTDGLRTITTRTGLPSFGIIPYLAAALRLPQEDALSLDNRRMPPGGGDFRIAVPRLPHIANFDDFDPLMAEPAVRLDMVAPGHPLPGDADLIILPGSKATVADLRAFKREGWDIDLMAHRRRGGAILGICAGYQMLGRTVADPQGIEGPPGEEAGLGLLDHETVLTAGKTLRQVAGVGKAIDAPFTGYEMHVGETTRRGAHRPFLLPDGQGHDPGTVSEDGRLMGCYVHGLLTGDAFRREFLRSLGVTGAFGPAYEAAVDEALDAVADAFEEGHRHQPATGHGRVGTGIDKTSHDEQWRSPRKEEQRSRRQKTGKLVCELTGQDTSVVSHKYAYESAGPFGRRLRCSSSRGIGRWGATAGRPYKAPTSHRALPTTKMPSHLHNRICETPH